MTLYQAISKRKSIRKYDMTPLDDEVLGQVKEFSDTLKPLFADIKVEHRFANEGEVKNILAVKAPHYIIISSENRDGYLPNAGFMFQQMDLYLTSIGLGSCWLGMAKPTEKIKTDLEFVIVLAFGKPLEEPYRQISEFKRKTLDKISNISDERLEPVRIAPSAMNSQPWFFRTDGSEIHVFCAKSGKIKAFIYEKINQIDIGIALAHLYITNSEKFEFHVEKDVQPLKGYYYMGTVKV